VRSRRIHDQARRRVMNDLAGHARKRDTVKAASKPRGIRASSSERRAARAPPNPLHRSLRTAVHPSGRGRRRLNRSGEDQAAPGKLGSRPARRHPFKRAARLGSSPARLRRRKQLECPQKMHHPATAASITLFISRTAWSRPEKIALATIECPMLSSRTPGIAAIALTLW
jgi:hypothetical protein